MALKRKRSNSIFSMSETAGSANHKSMDDLLEAYSTKETEIELDPADFTIKLKHPQRYKNKKFKSQAGFKPDIIDECEIQPQSKWNSMKDYSNFIVGGVTFRKEDIIEVKRPGEDGIPGERKEWIAKIMQIKASDPEHVYARVAWFYWPEDLPIGRQPYHGRNEAIESNHPDIISAFTVNGRADIKEWDEEDEDATFDGYYYRQEFDYLSKQLTVLRQICTCEGHYNPDTKIIHCPGCNIWMHEECIIADAVRRHGKTGAMSKDNYKPKKGKKGRYFSKKGAPKPEQNIAVILFDGKIRIKERIKKNDNDDKDSDSGLDADTIIDEDIRCLKCNVVIP